MWSLTCCVVNIIVHKMPISTVTPRINLSSRSSYQKAVPVIGLQFRIYDRNARLRRHQDRVCYTTGTYRKNLFLAAWKFLMISLTTVDLPVPLFGQSLKSNDPYKPSILSPPVREMSERSYWRNTSNHQTTLLNITKNELSKEEKLWNNIRHTFITNDVIEHEKWKVLFYF